MSGTAVKIIPKLSLIRQFSASPERVYRCWLDAEELKKWFGGTESNKIQFVNLNPRNGARFRIGLKTTDGTLRLYGGVIKKLSLPNELVFTWARGAGGTQQAKTLVSVNFKEKNSGTELILTQEYFGDETERLENESIWRHRLDRLSEII